MKKVFLLLITALLVLSVRANEQVSQPSLFKKSIQMERLRKDGRWLEAMDTATLILTYDNRYRAAVDFVHRYWDKTMQLTDERLQRLSDDESLTQAAERCEIYRLLDEVHDNLRVVRMPLYGPNEKWVWQPEVGYYTGHYDSERMKAFRLLLRKADEALRSFDAEEATLCYETALNKYLLTDGERSSNKHLIVEQCNKICLRHADSPKIYNSIFAYDICTLSLKIDPDQNEMSLLQQQIRQHIADLYLHQSEAAYIAGDSVQAYELRLSYLEWKGEESDDL